MLSHADKILMQQGAKDRLRWERSLRGSFAWREQVIDGHGAAAFDPQGASSPFSTRRSAGAMATDASRAMLRVFRAPPPAWLPGLAWPRAGARKLALGMSAMAVTAVVLASTLAIKGYVEHPAAWWLERLGARRVSPVYGADGVLIGAIDPRAMTADQAANLVYVPLAGPVPPTFAKALMALEEKHFQDGGIRNVCGIDLLSLARPVTSLGRAGGSGLTQQLAKQLMAPERGGETGLFAKGLRWAQQLGAACALHQALSAQGGKDAVLTQYANYVPVWQGGGVLRGIEVSSRIIFDVPPSALSDAQQLVMAAAAKEPLRLAPAGTSAIDCARMYPRTDNSRFEEETSRTHRERTNQCRVLHRAISAARLVLVGEALDRALAELRGYQRTGIEPANPFENISTKKLVNLSTRARAALAPGVLAQIRREAEETSLSGDSLILSLDAVAQHRFAANMAHALEGIQRSPAGRAVLCIPLIDPGDKKLALRNCGVDDGRVLPADVLAIKADVVTGGIKAVYASSPLILDARQSIGSIAKLIVMLAALSDGYDADTSVCPLQASDGGRVLHRVKAPTQGYANCDGGKNTISFLQATASSDNLAYYGIARSLGPAKLAAAARALGFEDAAGDSSLAYQMAFGTYGATPREVLAAAQRLFALAYDIRVAAIAPRILNNSTPDAAPAPGPLQQMLSQPQARLALRALLRAPVEAELGTLKVFHSDVDAGKSGSTQSTSAEASGRKYAHGKWAATFQAQRGEVNLYLVASSRPNVPLAHHAIGASVLAPAHRILLSTPE